MKILWGDIHNHCGITYGFGSLENALKAAKLQLDFCMITGHAMWPDIYEKNEDTEFMVNFHLEGFQKLKDHWEEVRAAVAEANSDELVTFQGYEMHSCHYGDYHIVSLDDRLPLIYRNSPRELVEDCGVESIVVPHHIGYTPGYRGINWEEFDETISPIVEVYSKHGCAMDETAPFPYYHTMGPRDSHNTVYEGLKVGHKFGFGGSTDHHAGFPGSYGDGMIAVLADAKDRKGIFEAIKAKRTYAVTGDKIQCMFSVNDALMGSEISAEKRNIKCDIETEYPLDKIVVYKNCKPIHVVNGEMAQDICKKGRYKVRVEMGWSSSEELFTWDGNFCVEGGSVVNYNTYFVGRNVLAPTENAHHDINDVNKIDNFINRINNKEVEWRCQTVENISTIHGMTDHIVFEVEGDLDTQVTITVNGQKETHTIGELVEYGYSHHVKPYHSHAYKVHRAVPQTQYQFHVELKDDKKEQECDVYHAEVYQKNGHCAFITPVYVK